MFAVRGSAASLCSTGVVLLCAVIFLSAVAASVVTASVVTASVVAACATDDSREAADTVVCGFARCWVLVAWFFEAVSAGSSAPSTNGAPRALMIATQKIAELMCFMAGLLM